MKRHKVAVVRILVPGLLLIFRCSEESVPVFHLDHEDTYFKYLKKCAKKKRGMDDAPNGGGVGEPYVLNYKASKFI